MTNAIDKKTIELGRGMSEILFFGMRFDAVKKALGKPDEVHHSQVPSADGEDTGDTVSWIYNKLGITLYFDEEDEWRLGTIETDDKDILLNGKKLIGHSFKDVKKFLENMGIGEIAQEHINVKETDGYENELLFSESKCLNVWFEKKICTEIQWSPIYENEQRVWMV